MYDLCVFYVFAQTRLKWKVRKEKDLRATDNVEGEPLQVRLTPCHLSFSWKTVLGLPKKYCRTSKENYLSSTSIQLIYSYF